MTISANQSSNTHHKPLKLTLVLCGLLSACTDSSVSSPPTEPTNASEPLVVVGPSISAAQLANDNTVTVQNALALVTDEAVVVTRPIELPAAANPDQTGTSTETSVETAAETTVETTAETATDPIDASTDNANAEPDSVITQVETEVPATDASEPEQQISRNAEERRAVWLQMRISIAAQLNDLIQTLIPVQSGNAGNVDTDTDTDTDTVNRQVNLYP